MLASSDVVAVCPCRMPTYYATEFGLDVGHSAALSVLPWGLNIVCANVAGVVGDKVRLVLIAFEATPPESCVLEALRHCMAVAISGSVVVFRLPAVSDALTCCHLSDPLFALMSADAERLGRGPYADAQADAGARQHGPGRLPLRPRSRPRCS